MLSIDGHAWETNASMRKLNRRACSGNHGHATSEHPAMCSSCETDSLSTCALDVPPNAARARGCAITMLSIDDRAWASMRKLDRCARASKASALPRSPFAPLSGMPSLRTCSGCAAETSGVKSEHLQDIACSSHHAEPAAICRPCHAIRSHQVLGDPVQCNPTGELP